MSIEAQEDLVHAYQKAVRDLQHARARQGRRRNSVLRALRKWRDREHALKIEAAGLRERVATLETGLRQMRENLIGGGK